MLVNIRGMVMPREIDEGHISPDLMSTARFLGTTSEGKHDVYFLRNGGVIWVWVVTHAHSGQWVSLKHLHDTDWPFLHREMLIEAYSILRLLPIVELSLDTYNELLAAYPRYAEMETREWTPDHDG